MNAVVLASGGLDSTVAAAIAKEEGWALFLVTVGYGQRHHVEIACAKKIAAWIGAKEHKILHLDLSVFGGSALVGQGTVPKHRSEKDRKQGIPNTYVPARNTIFLSLALAYAEVSKAKSIFIGANVLDYSGYPDCRPEFLQAFQQVARLGTKMSVEGSSVEIKAPLLQLSKAQIIQRGIELGVPFELTHSCYDPNEEGVACGQCDSCLIRLEGFRQAGKKDPVSYQVG
ncbi:7-cyano-7-deazaguanine synthase QueC [Candidatus Nitronereus thalassa]|uniref:7-cyano-7-deazaguanine synthase n=1 Tax=Candidatus Nitronereus thalassa TaxID=3020898 RepID=A0ABU3K514_9BACT|nr:7-cyano-7-deazaguanine synthase QueC [Candidatus Nitronereus thalassa]MDT7041476.1 7-cyano-7-deazaguanine synthase QueC [Candidatus Nitronereus thalassa]